MIPRLPDPGFALGGEGVEFFGAAVGDEALLDPHGEQLLVHGARMALGNGAKGAHEEGPQLEGLGGFRKRHGVEETGLGRDWPVKSQDLTSLPHPSARLAWLQVEYFTARL